MWGRNSGSNTLETYRHVAETVVATPWRRLKHGVGIVAATHWRLIDTSLKQWRQHPGGDSDVRQEQWRQHTGEEPDVRQEPYVAATHWRRPRREAGTVVTTH